MAWEHLDINRPHLVYIILGGYTSLFMLCSSVIKERLYIGEATVATIVGIIFGPHAANLINPMDWGNTDQITLEFSRIVLVVQCFAVGVELPRAYMERHWKSVVMLLVPVMTFGWLITSLFVWWMFMDRLNWLDSLCVAACVTATDPVLASSVVGKGKFARRVPKHLRDLLSAESGCNDGMAFPFIYLALYVIRYHHHPDEVSLHWFVYTILYECIFGCIYGVLVGYVARRAIRYAHEHDLIDRESFLVFYFVLALFCAGSGSILGLDDLLVGFACGVGFSNDGWFLEKTEEAHVSNVIDLLINLAFFVYFGTIIPWEQYNSAILGITPWRLVVIGLLVILFRRIPIMMVLKPVIPDIKTWREALFAGHFGPIGVGALFVAILARAELETETTTPLAVIPEAGFPHLNVIEMIWPITTFLVICSIVVHGSSIAVFTLGKHINTLTLTLSYTQANDEGPKWMERLPRIQSRSKSSMSLRRPESTDVSDVDEKDLKYPPGVIAPIGIAGNFIRRQRDEEKDSSSRSSSTAPRFRRKKWDQNIGPGGPISQSAIAPQPRRKGQAEASELGPTDSDTLRVSKSPSAESPRAEKRPQRQQGEEEAHSREPAEEIYEEGDDVIVEDAEGNVLKVIDTEGETKAEKKHHIEREARKVMKEKDVENGVSKTEDPDSSAEDSDTAEKLAEHGEKLAEQLKGVGDSKYWQDMRKMIGLRRREEDGPSNKQAEKPRAQKRGAALAYQFGNTIIVEDEDGEVLKKYEIPAAKREHRPGGVDRQASFMDNVKTRDALQRMGTYLGLGKEVAEEEPGTAPAKGKKKPDEDSDDEHIRFTIGGSGGRRMSKADFLAEIQRLDPKARAAVVEKTNAPEAVKHEARKDAANYQKHHGLATSIDDEHPADTADAANDLTKEPSHEDPVPFHNVSADIALFQLNRGSETAAQRRRRSAARRQDRDLSPHHPVRSTITVDDETPAERRRREAALGRSAREDDDSDEAPAARGRREEVLRSSAPRKNMPTHLDEGETAAERRRREGALGIKHDDSSPDSDDEATSPKLRQPPPTMARSTNDRIRFADTQRPSSGSGSGGNGSRLKWSDDVGSGPRGK